MHKVIGFFTDLEFFLVYFSFHLYKYCHSSQGIFLKRSVDCRCENAGHWLSHNLLGPIKKIKVSAVELWMCVCVRACEGFGWEQWGDFSIAGKVKM